MAFAFDAYQCRVGKIGRANDYAALVRCLVFLSQMRRFFPASKECACAKIVHVVW